MSLSISAHKTPGAVRELADKPFQRERKSKKTLCCYTMCSDRHIKEMPHSVMSPTRLLRSLVGLITLIAYGPLRIIITCFVTVLISHTASRSCSPIPSSLAALMVTVAR